MREYEDALSCWKCISTTCERRSKTKFISGNLPHPDTHTYTNRCHYTNTQTSPPAAIVTKDTVHHANTALDKAMKP